jgi:hypothetical protein
MRSIVSMGFACAMLAGPAPALADVATQTFASSVTDAGGYSSSGGSTFSSVAGAASSISAAGPTVSAQAVSDVGIHSSDAAARLTYHFTINLPAVGAYQPDGLAHVLSIPLLITYSGSADGSGGFSQAVVGLTVRGASGTQFEDGLNCSPGEGSSGCGTIGGTASFAFAYLFDNGLGQVDLRPQGEIELHAYASGLDNGSGYEAYATIDPTLAIDPTFAASHPGYSLTVEPLSPAPEPGEWAMIGAGLGIAGFAARRRRKA